MSSGLYCIRNKESGKVYIGRSANIKSRIKQHVKMLDKGKHHCRHLQNAWNKYGRGAFKPEVIYSGDPEELQGLEQLLLDTYGSEFTYNSSRSASGGDTSGRTKKDKARSSARKRESAKRFYATLSDKDRHNLRALFAAENGMYGRTHSEDAKARISKSLKKLNEALTPDERKAKYGRPGSLNGMYGRTHSEEAKRKILAAGNQAAAIRKRRAGKSYDEIYGDRAAGIREKLSEHAKTRTGDKNPFYGKTHSKEAVERIKIANKGNKPPNMRKVKIDGKIFESCRAAALNLDVCTATIVYRIGSKNPKFSEYEYLT